MTTRDEIAARVAGGLAGVTPTREASIRRHIARLKQYEHVDEFKRETIQELVEYWEGKLETTTPGN